MVAQQLTEEGYEVLGSHVTVRTSEGRRVIDHLVKTPTGEIIAVEVKSGRAVRNAGQLTKDALMATEGAKVIGKNAPEDIRNTMRTIETIERLVP